MRRNKVSFNKILKTQYLELKQAGKIPKSIPYICVLVVNKYKDGKPPHAKYHIVVLGNFKDRLYHKSQL